MATVVNNTTTLGDMVSQVYFIISEREDSVIFGRSNVIRAINDGLARIVRKMDRNQTDATTSVPAGTRRVSIPDSVSQLGRALVDAVFIDGTEISSVANAYNDGETGTPESYFIDGDKIVLVPTPDTTVVMTVRYRQEHEPLSDDDDTTTLPDAAVTAAIFYACYVMKLKDEEFASADRFKAEFEDTMKDVLALQTGVYHYADTTEGSLYGGAM